MPDDPIDEIETKEKVKQIQVQESIWENIGELQRYLSYRDHKSYSMSETIYQLIIAWNKYVGYTPTQTPKEEQAEATKKKTKRKG